MKKIVLLTNVGNVAPNIAKGLFTVIGISWMMLSMPRLTQESVSTFDWVSKSIMIVLGIGFVVYAWVAFSPSNSYCPRVEIDKDCILIRPNFFKTTLQFSWTDIGAINISGEKLDIILKNNIEHQFKLRTSVDAFKEINAAIDEQLTVHQGITLIPS